MTGDDELKPIPDFDEEEGGGVTAEGYSIHHNYNPIHSFLESSDRFMCCLIVVLIAF